VNAKQYEHSKNNACYFINTSCKFPMRWCNHFMRGCALQPLKVYRFFYEPATHTAIYIHKKMKASSGEVCKKRTHNAFDEYQIRGFRVLFVIGYCILCIAYCVVCTAYCVVCTAYCVLYTV